MSDLDVSAPDRLIADLAGIPLVTDPKVVRRRSRDFFWYSPILNELLDGKSADLIVAPRDESEVILTAAACARHRVPVTVRAGGTGNYGQAVPLKGGVLLDISALTDIEWIKPGILRVGAGAKMNAIDASYHHDNLELALDELKEVDPDAAKAYTVKDDNAADSEKTTNDKNDKPKADGEEKSAN